MASGRGRGSDEVDRDGAGRLGGDRDRRGPKAAFPDSSLNSEGEMRAHPTTAGTRSSCGAELAAVA